MGRPREHGTATHDALLAVAGEILGAEGVNGVTVRRVAEAAGTTTRAVYTLFGDKNGLLRALFRQMAEVMTGYHEAVPELDDPVEEIQQPGGRLSRRGAGATSSVRLLLPVHGA